MTVPPRHGKSRECSIDFPAWYLGRNPTKEIITCCYSFELAQDFGGRTRDKVNAPEYKYIFPGVKLREDIKAKGRWKTKQGGGYLAAGVGGPITGHGANIILIDDPIKNREEAESQVYREKTWEWFTSTAFTRLEPGGVCVIILTRWHQDDLVGRILASPELGAKTKLLRFAAISERDEHPHRSSGEPLWPNKYPIDKLAEIRSIVGPYDWSALYQGNPVRTENQEFKPEWYRYIDEARLSMMNTSRFLTVDTAMSKKAQADFTGFCDNSINSEKFWHLRTWQVKIGPEELVDTLFTLHHNNKYEAIGIERTAYLDGLKPYIDSEQRKRQVFLPIKELVHKQTSKEIRIRGLIPAYASGTIFHVENWCKVLEQQQASFPVGIHDDVLDAAAYQLQIVQKSEGQELVVNIPVDY